MDFIFYVESILFNLHIVVFTLRHAMIFVTKWLYNFWADFSCLATYDVQETTTSTFKNIYVQDAG